MINYTFFIARRYFRKGRTGYLFLTNLFAIISVALGVASLILVLGVMNGFDQDLRKKIIGITPAVTVQLPPETENTIQVIEQILSLPEAKDASPFSETQAILRSSGYLTAAVVKAVDLEAEDRVTGFGQYLSFPVSTKVAGLILGAELAKSLGVKAGERVEVITGYSFLPQSFPVCGTFRTGLYHFDAGLAFLTPPSAAAVVFPSGSRPQAIGVKVDNIYAADVVARKLAAHLGSFVTVDSWIDRNQTLFAALALERKAMAAILVLIILVAGFNICTSLMMTVWRKSKEIGTLRALGVSSRGIRTIFLWMGLLSGLWGVAAGLSVGLSLAYFGDRYQLVKLPGMVYDLSYLPIRVRGGDILWITLVAFAITLVASIFPAAEAARTAPATTLRTE